MYYSNIVLLFSSKTKVLKLKTNFHSTLMPMKQHSVTWKLVQDTYTKILAFKSKYMLITFWLNFCNCIVMCTEIKPNYINYRYTKFFSFRVCVFFFVDLTITATHRFTGKQCSNPKQCNNFCCSFCMYIIFI